jgi:hypothetical protein
LDFARVDAQQVALIPEYIECGRLGGVCVRSAPADEAVDGR